jgi:hypothetical protein
MSVIVRRLLVLGLALAAALALPGASWATVRGGCLVTGSATSSGSIDLTSETEWHMKSTDVAGGSGTAPSPQTSSTVAAYALGIAIPIAAGSGDGSTEGSVEGLSVELYSILGARFVVAGESAGEGGSCEGEVTIILDDVDPLFTVLGGGGLLVALLGVLVLLWAARSPASCAGRFLAGLFGGLGGLGIALAMEQFGYLDPTQPFGLAIAIGAALIGFMLNGRFASAPVPPPAAPAPAPTPPPSEPPSEPPQVDVEDSRGE